MSEIRKAPCLACPYRRDVASGVWADEEYDKLVEYDAPTGDQPFVPFSCHDTTEQFCHGWAVVHTNRGHEYDLIALRFAGSPQVPDAACPLFSSGTEAAEHGKRDGARPNGYARKTQARLLRKHPRLRI